MIGKTLVRLSIAVLVLVVIAFVRNGTETGERPEPNAKVKTTAAAEAGLRAELDTLAGLAGTSVTGWMPRTVACDTARPGGLWVMLGSARLPVPADRQKAAVTAIVAHWRQPGWKVYDQPDGPRAADGRWLSGWAMDADMNFDLHTRTAGDFLTVKFSTSCFQPAKGENPAAG